MATGVEPQYKGEVLNCVRNGRGSYRYEIGGNGLFVYDGPWINGQKNGPHGKFTVKGAHQVTGDFRDGEITGFGVKTWSDGRRYEGEWLKGEMHGKGQWISNSGDETYVGDFKDNKRHGFGVLTLTRTPSVYSGNFSFHKREGLGSYFCPNLVFVEGNFSSNYINGRTMVRWHDVACLNGSCSDGLFENLCEFLAADNSYEFRGTFSKGLPLPFLEASYIYLQLDRSLIISKTIDVDQLTAASKKSALNSTKKVKAVEVEICLPQVQVGSELGILVLTSGTQRDVDCERQRIDESASAAAVLVSAVKPSKNTRSLTQITELELGDPDCPAPAQKYSVPAERRRNVIVRVRQLCCGKNDSELLSTPVAKGAVKATVVEAKTVPPESYGDAIVFWLKGLSQEEFSSRSGRFPMTSVAYIGGVLVAPVSLGSLEDDFGVSTDTAATEALKLKQSKFTAAAGALLRRAVKESSEFGPAIAVTSHALLFTPPASTPGSTRPGTTPSVQLRVPYCALHNPEKSISVIADFCLNQSHLYDAAPAGEGGDGEQAGKETSPLGVREITVIVISKELLQNDATSSASNQSQIAAMSRSLNLVLLVPEETFLSAKKRYKTLSSAAIKIKAATQEESIAREEAKTLRKVASAEAATLHEKSMTSPKRKSTQVKKLAAHKESEADELPKSPSASAPNPLPFSLESLDEDFRDVEWRSCVWELRMITSTIRCSPGTEAGIEAGIGTRSVGAIGSSNGADKGRVEAEEAESTVTVQRWEGGAVVPSDWHSIALTARTVSRWDSDSNAGTSTGVIDFACIRPFDTTEVELGAGSGNNQAKPHFQLVLDGRCLDALAPDLGLMSVSDSDANLDVQTSTAVWLVDSGEYDAPRSTESAAEESSIPSESPGSPLALVCRVGGEGTIARARCSFFQGAVKALAVIGGDNLRHICEVTSCYAAWRAQGDRKNAGSKISSAEFPHVDSRCDSDKSVSGISGKTDSGSCPVPLDCIAVKEVTVTLQGGYGEVENILLPLDTPPGRYVIDVSDGILPACLRAAAPDMNPLGSLYNSSSSSSNSSGCSLAVRERVTLPTSPVRSRAALEDMKDLAAVINPIRPNRQIIFNVVSAAITGT